jgi:protein involved in polysaccharide export with SLBB domain
MDVWVNGCVMNPGKVELPRFSKLRTAIYAAGGFRRNKLLFPSGVITIRSRRKWRPKRTRSVNRPNSVRNIINYRSNPSSLDTVWLREGDHVIVQAGGLGLTYWCTHVAGK